MQRKKRTYRQVHDSYLIEWLGITYPPGTWRTNVALGQLRPELAEKAKTAEELKLLRPFLASADAVVILPEEVHIIECMIRHEPGALEDLIKYKKLFRETPEFSRHWNKPIKLILLTPLDAPFYEELAKDFGVEVKKYRPVWILEYLGTYRRKEWRGKLSGVKY